MTTEEKAIEFYRKELGTDNQLDYPDMGIIVLMRKFGESLTAEILKECEKQIALNKDWDYPDTIDIDQLKKILK